MAVNIIDIENSSNIGIFFKSNDKYILVPNELPEDKSRNLKNYLNVEPIISTISGTRLNGALTIMNNSGILVSKIITERELRLLREQVDLPVEILPTKYTCIGNIITVNDKGAYVSEIISKEDIDIIKNTLNVEVEKGTVASHVQVGSLTVATNNGAIIHPLATKEEILKLSKILKVNIEPATINHGVPIVASGIIVNSENAIVGKSTSGPELDILSRVFNV